MYGWYERDPTSGRSCMGGVRGEPKSGRSCMGGLRGAPHQVGHVWAM